MKNSFSGSVRSDALSPTLSHREREKKGDPLTLEGEGEREPRTLIEKTAPIGSLSLKGEG
jgi:hypothetical protein